MAIRQRNEKRRGKDERISVAQIGGDRSCQKQGKYSSDKRYKEHEKPPLSVSKLICGKIQDSPEVRADAPQNTVNRKHIRKL